MSLFYKQNAAARFFVDQTNGKVYEVVGGGGEQYSIVSKIEKRGLTSRLDF